MVPILLTLLFSLQSFAFEGQPKTVEFLPNMANKATFQIDDISRKDLDENEDKSVFCNANNVCTAYMRVMTEKKATVNDMNYEIYKVNIATDKEGQIAEPMKIHYLLMKNSEFSNSVVMDLKHKQPTICFGISSRKTCSYYQVKEFY